MLLYYCTGLVSKLPVLQTSSKVLDLDEADDD